MGLFFGKPKYTVGDESEKQILILKNWENEHFSRTRDFTSANYNMKFDYSQYKTESGSYINLSSVKVPDLKKSTDTLVGMVKDFIRMIRLPSLPEYIKNCRKLIAEEISEFRGNAEKLKKLDEECRADELFCEIDHIFRIKLKALYGELIFMKFENLGEKKYFAEKMTKIKHIVRDMKALNRDFSEYMYAIMNVKAERTSQDMELIRARVLGMADAAEKFAEK